MHHENQCGEPLYAGRGFIVFKVRRERRKMIQRQMDVHNPTLLPDTQWAKNPRFNPPKMSKIVPFLSKPPSKDFRFKSLQL